MSFLRTNYDIIQDSLFQSYIATGTILYKETINVKEFKIGNSFEHILKNDSNNDLLLYSTNETNNKITFRTEDDNSFIKIKSLGDSYIELNADALNNGSEETRNCWIKYTQDGGGTIGLIGLCGNQNAEPIGSAFTGARQNGLFIYNNASSVQIASGAQITADFVDKNIGLGGVGQFGGGSGVISIVAATTAPTTNPPSATIIWVDASDNYNLKIRKPNGTVGTISYS